MKLKQEIEDKLVKYFANGGRPKTATTLINDLGVESKNRKAFRDVLREMTHRGQIRLMRGKKYGTVQKQEPFCVTGTISVHAQGFGHVAPDEEIGGDVFIPASRMHGARHRDRVRIEVSQNGSEKLTASGAKKMEGSVIEVLKRGISEIVGLLFESPSGWKLTPDDPRLPGPVFICDVRPGVRLKTGTKAVAELVELKIPSAPSAGRIIEVLGAQGEPGIDILSVMRQHQLQEEFPEEVMREVNRIRDGLTPADVKGRQDLREMLIFTIDPEDAKDFDDAISMEALPNGNWRMGIHIADVTHYVKPGSQIDREAFARANSAYLVDRVVPMLPFRLTNDICSLLPNQDRLTHSVFVEVTPDGRTLGYETAQSVIHSKARLTYGMVQDFFVTGQASRHIPASVVAVLMQMRPLARAIRARRLAAGSLDFQAPEIKCILKRNGKVERIEKRDPMEACQLIEEFMLLANLAVADCLHKAKNQPAIYRIHEAPSEKQWGKMEAELASLGIQATMAQPCDINKVLYSITEPHLLYPVTIAILRNLNRAIYSEKKDIHFGLAFDCYTHFTSPIRRYPDLVVHRLLNAIETRKPAHIQAAEIHDLAQHCTQREQNAEEAENATILLKLIEYYHDRLAAGKAGPYDACVSGFNPRGIVLELVESLQRGMLLFETLTDDYYTIHPSGTRAEGRRKGRVFRLGDAVSVWIARVDTRQRRIEFVIEEKEESKTTKKKRRSEPSRKELGKTPKREEKKRRKGKR